MNIRHEPWAKKYGVVMLYYITLHYITFHIQRFAFGEGTTHLELG